MLICQSMSIVREQIQHHHLRLSSEFKGYIHVDERSLKNPIDYFKAFFIDEMTQLIADQTNFAFICKQVFSTMRFC